MSVSDSAQALEPLAVRGDEAARLAGISPRLWRGLDSAAKVPRGVRLGRAKVWIVAELRDWLAAGAPSRDRWETLREQKE
jgi:predicted DNA-binding transcriptional regulator AlpA